MNVTLEYVYFIRAMHWIGFVYAFYINSIKSETELGISVMVAHKMGMTE